MSHTKLRPFIVKVSVLGYFPLHSMFSILFVKFLFLLKFIHIYMYTIVEHIGSIYTS